MAYSKIDLHCHSLASDGDLSPRDVVSRAAANGVEVLALTDHDTIAGLDEASEAARDLGMQLVSGIELSCQWGAHNIHVLGLNFPHHDVIRQAERQQTQARLQRGEEIGHKLAKKGYLDMFAKAKDLSASGIPGRPHFAQAMVDAGYVSSQAEAFKKYLGSGKIGDVKSMWPSIEEALGWIKAAGGSAVIAHPRKYTMSLTKLRELIVEFKELGGDGIEVVVSGQKQGEIGMLSDLCQRFEVKASVGSDFHSPSYPWADLGKIPTLPESVRPIWDDWELIEQ